MAFVKKTWKDRIVQYANRRLLTKSGGEVEQVTVTRDEGTISEAGDQFNASNMNDLEQRVKDGFDGLTADTLPIESGSATNTKDYIDNGLSGKADTSETCKYIQTTVTWNANTNRFDIPSGTPRPVQAQQCLIGRNSSTGALYALWYVSTEQNFQIGATLSGNAPTSGQTCYINYVIPNT